MNASPHDEGWEVRPERKQANLDFKKNPGSSDPRPAHVRNFLDCVKTRRAPVLNLDVAHRVSTTAHLGNIAYRTGHKVVWDSAKEIVVGDKAADKLVSAPYRKPWKLPYLSRT